MSASLNNSNLVSRNGLTWLLVAQVLVIIPHLFYSPWWLLLVWLCCALWRIQIYRMRLDYPDKLVRFILVVLLGAGIFYARGTIVGLDGGVVLLIAAFSMKLLELRTRRDALVVIYLGFIAVVAAYLFDNSFLWVAYSLLPITALLAALIGLYQTKLADKPLATIRLAGLLLLQALPLMLLLFFFFPRLEPLWNFAVPKKQQASGLSNSMTPGDLADMVQSKELVFRATFDDGIPERKQLYWKMLTLETYDGKTWNQAWDTLYPSSESPMWEKRGSSSEYTVVMQPSSKTWLAALDTADSLPPKVSRQPDFHLEKDRPVDTLYSYRLSYWPNAKREPYHLGSRRWLNLQLPNNQNQDPRARAKGRELKQQYNGDPEKIVQALLNHYKEQPYYYTLQTPDMGANSIDRFFFDLRSGFCEHYASATAFILRAADVPARVVLGYQGGEINTSGNFVQVRQMEAHAWVEYWQQGKGWIRIDPTFQVAPNRIDLNLNNALSAEDQEQLDAGGILGNTTSTWLSGLRMTWENFNNHWDLFILGYNGEEQKGLLQRLFGQANVWYLSVVLIGGVFMITTCWLLLLLKPWRRERNPALRYYYKFEQLLAHQGVSAYIGEGPVAFATRAAKELPAHAVAIEQFVAAFVANQYAGNGSEKTLQQALAKLKKQSSWRARLFKK